VLDVLANVRALLDSGCGFSAITQGLELRPDGDAISRLLLQVLASVAEFERELIRERTIAGIAKARARGVTLGRPGTAIDVNAARTAIEAGMTLRWIAVELDVSPSMLVRALQRSEKGVRKSKKVLDAERAALVAFLK
jgi:DNA invertase Pin-like site-specific DNA recombinase